jgi:hypothetical protein
MSQMGLGRVKTLWEREGNVDFGSLGEWVPALFGSNYALIAAMSGWMPMMFITRVRL